jgi:sporulation protein YlmC with PRC-barrel domain
MRARISKRFCLLIALSMLLVLLSACGNDEPEVVVAPEPTTAIVATPTIAVVAVVEAATATPEIVETATPAEEAVTDTGDVIVITGTRLITGTRVTTDIVVTTETVVLARELITTLIVSTDVTTNIVLTDTEQSVQTETSLLTETARVAPQVVGAVAVVGVADADNRFRSAATLIGYPVVSQEGAVIGILSDMVVNLQSGNVVFVILEYSGAIATGDNRLPLPLRAFRFDAANEALTLAIDEETLAGQNGFGAEWPNLREPGYLEETAVFWEGLNTPVIGTDITNTLRATTGILTTASQLINITIGDPTGTGFGMIGDLLVNLAEGRLVYAVVTSGGALDLGEERIVVPLAAFNFEQRTPILAVAPTALEAAPRFDPNWTVGNAEPTWVEEIERYWAGL